MYLFDVQIKNSSIEGKGVFANEEIPKGSVVWKFDQRHDLTLSREEFDQLKPEDQTEIRKVAYVSPTSDRWVYPPKDDPARFTNHAEVKNNLSAVFDQVQSPEPFFIANQDIKVGDELTVNYNEFDASIKQGKPEWMQ